MPESLSEIVGDYLELKLVMAQQRTPDRLEVWIEYLDPFLDEFTPKQREVLEKVQALGYPILEVCCLDLSFHPVPLRLTYVAAHYCGASHRTPEAW